MLLLSVTSYLLVENAIGINPTLDQTLFCTYTLLPFVNIYSVNKV
jgi:hypothetical protein